MKISYVEPMEQLHEKSTEEIVSYFDETTIVSANERFVREIRFFEDQSHPEIVSNVTMDSRVLAIQNYGLKNVTYILTDDFVLHCKRRGRSEFAWRTNVSTSFSSSSQPSHASLRIFSSDKQSVIITVVTYVDETTRASVLDTITGQEIWHRNRLDENEYRSDVLSAYLKNRTSLHVFSKIREKAHEIHIVSREKIPVFIVCNGQHVWGLDIFSGQTLLSLDPHVKEDDFPGTVEEIHLIVRNQNIVEKIQIVRRSTRIKEKRICPLHVRISRDNVLHREFPLCTRKDRSKITRHVLPRVVVTKTGGHEEPNIHIFRTSRGLIQTYGLDTGAHVRTTQCNSVTWSTDGANQFPISFSEALTRSPFGENLIVRGEHAMCIIDLESGLAVAHTRVSGFTSLSRPVHFVDINNDKKNLDFSILTTVGLTGFSVTPKSLVQSMMVSDWFVLVVVLITWYSMMVTVLFCSVKKSTAADASSSKHKLLKIN